ncbi:MAG: imidazole glycerol phosphate synthase subunit HisH [Sulfuricaulis sp.]|uniref:imidazole glycerol phosphate synthase subunit HisH n=1 Tax=Sulfuricaulis sp. TaxID=2003553 RepID=UPI0034A5A2C3
MITLVDYGLGNIQAFANVYRRMNVPVTIAKTPHELAGVRKLVLPGVGAFDWAMTRLTESGMRPYLDDLVMEQECPVLGVCVGMQMLARSSDEGTLAGLGWMDAEVKKFNHNAFTQPTHLPHMGWNDVLPQRRDCLFQELEALPRYYFLHSYYFLPRHTEQVLAVTDYNGLFASAVRSGNVFGVQFHPEKSHQWGIQLLKNFAEL